MIRFPIKLQVVLALVLALLVSFLMQQILLLEPAFSLINPETEEPSLPTAITTPEITAEATGTAEAAPTSSKEPTPYVTLDEVVMVRVKLFPDAAPIIESVLALPEGRLSVLNEGEYSAKLVDDAGNTVYELKFEPVFLAGEPVVEQDEITMLFILPGIEGVTQIVIDSPYGEVVYDYE